MASENELIYVKTNIGGWFFDATFKMDHETKTKITDFPIQTGASLTDHAFVQPAVLIMDIGVSDSFYSETVQDQFSTGNSRSVVAYNILLDLQNQRIPVQIFTRLKLYQNMLIESVIVPDDYTTMNALKATVTFREIQVANVQTVQISSKPDSTNTTNRGIANPVNPNQSIISQAQQLLMGLFK